jgi:hypothetical protein
MSLICFYCHKISINYPMTHIRKAVKPPRRPRRYEIIGYCCERCEQKGKPTIIDPWRKHENNNFANW